MTTTVGDDFPIQQARVRELRQSYIDIGDAGKFGLSVIDGALLAADQAWASGDIVAIVRAYTALKGCE